VGGWETSMYQSKADEFPLVGAREVIRPASLPAFVPSIHTLEEFIAIVGLRGNWADWHHFHVVPPLAYRLQPEVNPPSDWSPVRRSDRDGPPPSPPDDIHVVAVKSRYNRALGRYELVTSVMDTYGSDEVMSFGFPNSAAVVAARQLITPDEIFGLLRQAGGRPRVANSEAASGSSGGAGGRTRLCRWT